MSESYQKEQNDIIEKLNKIKLAQKEETINNNAIEFVDIIKKYKGIEKLTRPIVIRLIDKIAITEKYDDKNGVKNQDVIIYYKLVGNLQPLSYRVPKIRPIFIGALAKRKCCECGKEYQPTSNVQNYCS